MSNVDQANRMLTLVRRLYEDALTLRAEAPGADADTFVSAVIDFQGAIENAVEQMDGVTVRYTIDGRQIVGTADEAVQA